MSSKYLALSLSSVNVSAIVPGLNNNIKLFHTVYLIVWHENQVRKEGLTVNFIKIRLGTKR